LACVLGLLAPPGVFAQGKPAAPREAATSWYGDLAAARAFMVDTAKAWELRRRAPVTVKALGTMSALEAVARGQADLVGSARPADPDTPIEANLQFTTVAWDALAILAHPRNKVKGLTVEQLRDIYAGRVTDWAALGGAPGAINVYAVAGPLDGIEWSLRRMLFGKGSARVAAKRWYINTQKLEEAIAIDPAGIGVSLHSLVAANVAIAKLSIDGVAPSLATLEAGTYPLPTRLYVAARREAPGQPSSVQLALRAREFIRDEPALRTAWRRRQLLPASEARTLRADSDERIAALHARLGVRVAAGPPAPKVPPPPKGRIGNPLRGPADPLERDPPAFVAGPRGSAVAAPADAGPLARAECSPAVFCR
jgi:phosphate transport system substrate-binding protein